MAQIAYAIYPGINAVISAQMTLSHGITPSVCLLEIDPQANQIALDGDLQLVQNDPAVSILFKNCRIDQGSIELNDGGLVTRLAIMDRRWKWHFALNGLSGSYNVRNPDLGGGTVGNSLDEDFKRTPHQLAILCFDAMGEIGYDISALPNDTYPDVHWEHENPAEALNQLVDSLGCRIALTLFDTVQIVRPGVGANLPDGAIETDGISVNLPERPDSLRVVCGPNRYQADLQLWAVGEDTDGTIKIIDSLSYKPSGGWASERPGVMWGVSDEPTALGQIPRRLAQQTVWYWYRVYLFHHDGTPLEIDGVQVTNRKQILPLESTEIELFLDHDGVPRPKPASVRGRFFDSSNWAYENTSASSTTRFGGGFQIDQERGIVMFDEPMFLIAGASSDEYQEADLSLRVAFSVKDRTTFAFWRHTRQYDFPDVQRGTGPREIPRDEIIRNSIFEYTTSGEIDKITTNESAVNVECDYYLQAARLEYHNDTSRDTTYVGLVPISPDGAIQQVTWIMHCESGFSTHGSRNDEFSLDVPSFRERRSYEDLRSRVVQRLKKQATAFSRLRLAQVARVTPR